MNKVRFVTIIMLCVSIFVFAGCGNNGNDNADMNNDTVTEETQDANDVNNSNETRNSNDSNNNDSIADDMADGIDKAADDVAEGIDDVTDDIDGNSKEDKSKQN